jgi:cell division protein FtsZ
VAIIKVIGIGRAGCNEITRMLRAGVRDAEFIALDTDADYLEITEAPIRILLGARLTAGLGAGGDTSIGRRSAEETRDQIKQAVAGADMVFLLGGMGGGTGTGAMPVVAEIARQIGVLTVAVVTDPFSFEGNRCKQAAEEGVKRLVTRVNTLIKVDNNELMGLGMDHLTVEGAFAWVNKFISREVQAIVESFNSDNFIATDSISLRTVLSDMGIIPWKTSRGQLFLYPAKTICPYQRLKT